MGGQGPAYAAEPAEFIAWVAPAGTFPAATDRVAGGMSSTTQCTNVPPGASGSSTTRAQAAGFAPAPLVQANGGDTWLPSQVNSTGMLAPSANAVLVTPMVSAAPTSSSAGWSWPPHPVTTAPQTRRTTTMPRRLHGSVMKRVHTRDRVRRVRRGHGRRREPGIDHEQRVPRQGERGRGVERRVGDGGHHVAAGQRVAQLDRVDLALDPDLARVAPDVQQAPVELEAVPGRDQVSVQV